MAKSISQLKSEIKSLKKKNKKLDDLKTEVLKRKKLEKELRSLKNVKINALAKKVGSTIRRTGRGLKPSPQLRRRISKSLLEFSA